MKQENIKHEESFPNGHWIRDISLEELCNTLEMETNHMISGGGIVDDCPEYIREYFRDKFAPRLLMLLNTIKDDKIK